MCVIEKQRGHRCSSAPKAYPSPDQSAASDCRQSWTCSYDNPGKPPNQAVSATAALPYHPTYSTLQPAGTPCRNKRVTLSSPAPSTISSMIFIGSSTSGS